MKTNSIFILIVSFLLSFSATAQSGNIAYIYGDVSSNGNIPSGSDDPFHQMLLTDNGSRGLTQFRSLVEEEGHTIEQFYDEDTTLNANFLNQFDVVIFSLHQKIWSTAERNALDAWIQSGGGIFLYSDSAAGGRFSSVGAQNPVGQRAVNNITTRYGMQVTVDQAAGTTAYRASNGASHPVVVGRPILEGEGVSPVAVDLSSGTEILIPYNSSNANNVSGNASLNHLQNITINNPQYAALANNSIGNGNVMVMFDRQPMWNNGEGSDINEEDNREILRRIVNFLAEDNNQEQNEPEEETIEEVETLPTTEVFIPNPNSTYYIDSPIHNLRIGATGNSEDPLTAPTTTTGANVEWRFVSNGNGQWHIDRADGGSLPRLRTDASESADMQETSFDGRWESFSFSQGAIDGTHFITSNNGPTNFQRLQVTPNGNVNMVPSEFDGTWESFLITEITSTNRIVHITKRNATGFAIDGDNGAANEQNVYLWSENENNINQQWIEIDRGNGFYTYQKMGTNFAIDGDNGGAQGQNVYLFSINENNQNQHWRKVPVGGGAFQLIKRNAPNFALDGGNGGARAQNINLSDASSTSQNLHWIITPIGDLDSNSSSFLFNNTPALNINKPIIYPNPVISTTTIQEAANSTINIYDINGKLQMTESIITNNETIDLSKLSSGLYYINVEIDQNTSTIKIVKN